MIQLYNTLGGLGTECVLHPGVSACNRHRVKWNPLVSRESIESSNLAVHHPGSPEAREYARQRRTNDDGQVGS